MKVQVVIPWVGPLPVWTDKFLARVSASAPTFQWTIIDRSWGWFRERIHETTGATPWFSVAPRKLCDYRPAFGHIFAEEIGDADWWGWADLDCVFGDVPSIITPEILEGRDGFPYRYDLVTDAPNLVNGPFTIIRNSYPMRGLYRLSDHWLKVFESPAHVAFDEHGFTQLVRLAHPLVRARFLEGVHESDNEIRTPELRDGKLYAPDGRELLTYHFPRTKWWPLP